LVPVCKTSYVRSAWCWTFMHAFNSRALQWISFIFSVWFIHDRLG
jgi:hypothetical protein